MIVKRVKTGDELIKHIYSTQKGLKRAIVIASNKTMESAITKGEEEIKRILETRLTDKAIVDKVHGDMGFGSSRKKIFTLFVDAPHAKDLNYGVKPHFVSLRNINFANWIQKYANLEVQTIALIRGGLVVGRNSDSPLRKPGLQFMEKADKIIKKYFEDNLARNYKSSIKQVR